MHRLNQCATTLSGVMMVLVFAMIMIGVVGRSVGFYLPGTDAFAGYAMAGAGFLAMGPALARGEHLRVSVLTDLLPLQYQSKLYGLVVVVAMVFSAIIAYFAFQLVLKSFQYNDISTQNDATPLWIVQVPMFLGLAVLWGNFAHLCLEYWRRGGVWQQAGETHHE